MGGGNSSFQSISRPRTYFHNRGEICLVYSSSLQPGQPVAVARIWAASPCPTPLLPKPNKMAPAASGGKHEPQGKPVPFSNLLDRVCKKTTLFLVLSGTVRETLSFLVNFPHTREQGSAHRGGPKGLIFPCGRFLPVSYISLDITGYPEIDAAWQESGFGPCDSPRRHFPCGPKPVFPILEPALFAQNWGDNAPHRAHNRSIAPKKEIKNAQVSVTRFVCGGRVEGITPRGGIEPKSDR